MFQAYFNFIFYKTNKKIPNHMTQNTSQSPSQSHIQITPLTHPNFEAWLPLWQDYLTFYETSLPIETTMTTWQKIIDSKVPIYGFGAFKDKVLVGITHVILHPNTWNTTECCYLEDLFVSESARGRGLGGKLIEHVYDFAAAQDCNRVYWTTQESNKTARVLYDKIANLTDMIQYRKNL